MNYKHGKSGSRAYSIWAGMLDRSHNPRSAAYANYGGRGIDVCSAWHSFAAFYADMGDPPAGHSLERKDNDRGYSPENCRWATRKEQGRNKRNNHFLTLEGETLPLSAWAERFGLKHRTVHQRITVLGWTPEQALKTPLVTKRKGIPRGERIAQFGAEHGVKFHDDQEVAA